MMVKEEEGDIYIEEKLAVTFYEFFRLLKLMEDNILEVEIPKECSGLNIFAETGITGISACEINAKNIRFQSSTGEIRIQDVGIDNSLTAHSVSGKIFCSLPGVLSDYDVDCRTERRDVCQPCYPVNRDAGKKVVLHSNMYVPELSFLGS